MQPELELLVLCASIRTDSKKEARIARLLRENFDGEYLFRVAARHGLTMLLDRRLHRAGPDVVPEDLLQRLKTYALHIKGRNLYLTSELFDVLELLASHQIPAIPLRGPILGQSLYGDPALRPFDDLDILLRRSDVMKAKDLLLDRGYRPNYQLTRTQEEVFLHYQCQYHFSRGDRITCLELHWELMPRFFCFSLEADRLWDRLESMSIGNVHVRGFCPEDSLLTLCVHAAKHLWWKLIWVCDVDRLIEMHRSLDWEQVLERARKSGGTRMLRLGLFLAHDLLGTGLPAALLREVQGDSAVRSLAERVRRRLPGGTESHPGALEMALFHLRARERLSDRLLYCYRLPTSLNAGDLEGWSLPRPFSFLYHVLRPVRLLRDACRRPARHDPAARQ